MEDGPIREGTTDGGTTDAGCGGFGHFHYA